MPSLCLSVYDSLLSVCLSLGFSPKRPLPILSRGLACAAVVLILVGAAAAVRAGTMLDALPHDAGGCFARGDVAGMARGAQVH